MDLQWRVARMRKWINRGDRENLTFPHLATLAGVSTRTMRRWAAKVRVLEAQEAITLQASGAGSGQPAIDGVSLPERPFLELLQPLSTKESQIQVLLAGERRRVLIGGSVDVEVLARVIEAVERC